MGDVPTDLYKPRKVASSPIAPSKYLFSMTLNLRVILEIFRVGHSIKCVAVQHILFGFG